jgi:type IV pilus assembly protein PilB
MAIDDQLGEVLVERGHITYEQFDVARASADRRGTLVGTEMLVAGALDTDTLLRVTSEVHQVPIADLNTFRIAHYLVEYIDPSHALERAYIPIRRSGAVLLVAMAYPVDIFTIDELRYSTGFNIETRVASVFGIRNAIQNALNVYPVGWLELPRDPEIDAHELDVGTFDFTSPNYYGDPLRGMAAEALRRRATELHIDMSETSCASSIRIDGQLYPFLNLDSQLPSSLIHNAVYLASLPEWTGDTPLSGTFMCQIEVGQKVRVLTCVIPTARGSRIVLHFHDAGHSLDEVLRETPEG